METKINHLIDHLTKAGQPTKRNEVAEPPFSAERLWRLISPAIPLGGRELLKHVMVTHARATARMRVLPDFLIIGARRGGTTSLAKYLRRHPQIAPTMLNVKGARFFDENFLKGELWYRSHFPTRSYKKYLKLRKGCPVLTGESSPYYLYHPLAPQRAAQMVPHAKLIVLLRNPIERAYSHWKVRRQDSREPLETFEEAVEAEPRRVHGEVKRILADASYYSFAHEHYSYITQGFYFEHLQRWFRYFPAEQFCILPSESLFERPQETYNQVLTFLGLPPLELPDFKRYFQTPDLELSQITRRRLVERFRPEIDHLQQWLEVDFGWKF